MQDIVHHMIKGWRMDVENWKVQLRKGVLEVVVLNILRNGALYGLEMINRLQQIPSLAITEGTIYPLLSRLRAEGLVFAEWVESGGGRPRRYYSLSEKGRRMIGELNDAWDKFVRDIKTVMDNSNEGGRK